MVWKREKLLALWTIVLHRMKISENFAIGITWNHPTILSAWFKQARTANTSIDGPDQKVEVPRVATHLGISGFQASNGWIDHYKIQPSIQDYVGRKCHCKSWNSDRLENWRTAQNSQQIPAKRHIFNVDETGFFYNLQPSETMTYKGDSCHGGTKSKQRVTVLLGFNADGTEKLPPLVTGTYNEPGCFRKVKNSPPNTHQIPIHGWL